MIDGEVMNEIVKDVVANVKPADSTLTYNEEMLKFRGEVENDVAELPDNTVVDIPF